jgi:hypothetical protein
LATGYRGEQKKTCPESNHQDAKVAKIAKIVPGSDVGKMTEDERDIDPVKLPGGLGVLAVEI